MATKETEDAPLIDLNEASIKKLITKAKKRGYVTYDELNEALPQGEMSSDQIEDIQAAISEMGVQIVESDDEVEAEKDEVEEIAPDSAGKKDTKSTAAAAPKKTVDARTDDPVRMYLREMGAVELLSREGEIAIAKRIEAGRDAMIRGLCVSPLTFEAMMVWRDELMNERILLRDLIDRDPKTCMWFHENRTFQLLATIPPTAEPLGRCDRAGKRFAETITLSRKEGKGLGPVGCSDRRVRIALSDTNARLI